MRKLALAIALGGALAVSAPAAAAVDLGGFSLDTGSFGTGYGVHSTGSQSGKSLTGFVNLDGSAVTFTSSDLLKITGSGEATVEPSTGVITNLDVDFAKAWDNITFSFAGDKGTFSLLVNGTTQFDSSNCSICTIGKGQNKFTLSGSGISSLSYTFDPGVDTAKQFRVEGVSSAVPEPNTWALMLIGFGAVGGAMRARKRKQTPAVSYA
jgi:hypothetical protein